MRTRLAGIMPATLTGPARYGRQWLLPASLAVAVLFSLAFVFPAVAADCVDADSDGYVACDGCDAPSGTTCGDCGEGNAAIHPGAAELCGDGVDNDCNGSLLEPDDPEDASQFCIICPDTNFVPGECDASAAGICRTQSKAVCSADLLSLECPEPSAGYKLPSTENMSEPPTCFDDSDNDCDGTVDESDTSCQGFAEVCDGVYDNDLDGIDDAEEYSLGVACTTGTGECARDGVLVCNDSGTGSECSALPGLAKKEQYGIGTTCSDGLDNDCDALIDGADGDCAPTASAELCDGIDNDLDGTVDDGFDVGESCTVGIGECANSGVKECAASRLETVCTVSADPPGVEGPYGEASCGDGLDNDCDGLADAADPECDANYITNLQVTCALPYTNGKPGGDCEGKHTIQYQVYVDGVPVDLNAVDLVHAELLGLRTDGSIKGIISDVLPGAEVQMNSRLSPLDYKMSTKSSARGVRYEVFAPVPMLRVTARDGDAEAVAYCSNIPFMDVIRPNSEVVSVSSGDSTEVVVALPRTDLASMVVYFDGVDILDALGLTPEQCVFGQPSCGGTIEAGVCPGPDCRMVEVEDLLFDIAPGIGDHASNTLTMTIRNMGGGGHIVYVDGDENPPFLPDISPDCHVDDVADAGTIAALEVEIATPMDQQSVPSAPVNVTGTVRHGIQIAGLKLNGKSFPVTGQVHTTGDGMFTADQWELLFDENLNAATNDQLTASSAPLGTVQRGSNKLVADASDNRGNRAFDTQVFALGDVSQPVSPAAATLSDFKAEEMQLNQILGAVVQDAVDSTSVDIENAFVAGIEPGAVQAIFNDKCPAAIQEFKSKIKTNLEGYNFGTVDVSPSCSCDISVPLVLSQINFGSQGGCTSTFSDGTGGIGEINVEVTLPDVEIIIAAKDQCEDEGLFGECIARTVVDVTATARFKSIAFNFKITEETIENGDPPIVEGDTGITIGVVEKPEEGNANGLVTNNSDIECWGAEICNAFNIAFTFFVEAITFGLADGQDIWPMLEVDPNIDDFTASVGASDPDPIEIGDMQINGQVVENYGRAEYTPTNVPDIEITTEGITAAFSSSFATQYVDPNAEQTPGAALTPAAAPGPDQQNPAENTAFIVLADDTINQLFNSMAQSGLKTECKDTGKTVGTLLPPDCETLSGDNLVATATIQGICHGVKEDDCYGPDLVGAVEIGMCWGVQGAVCTDLVGANSLQTAVMITTCENAPRLSIDKDDPLLFCSRQSIAPQLLLNDQGATPDLETNLLLNDMTVAMVVDKPTLGHLDQELADLPNCFSAEATSLTDCNLYAACIDITLDTVMSLNTSNPECNPGVPAFMFSVDVPDGIFLSGLQAGVMCGEAATQTDDNEITSQAAADQTVEEISENTAIFTPPLCAEGMSLGNILNFTNPKLISIDTANEGWPEDGYDDYFGIIGEITPPSP